MYNNKKDTGWLLNVYCDEFITTLLVFMITVLVFMVPNHTWTKAHELILFLLVRSSRPTEEQPSAQIRCQYQDIGSNP